VLSHLDDLDADFRAFYQIAGIGDMEFGDLSSARFFALAERCVCYPGAVRSALIAQVTEQDDETEDGEPDEDEQLAASLNMEAL
jgi:hypothetical protein